MALSSDQIANLLGQGAITAAQAQALGAQSTPTQDDQGPPATRTEPQDRPPVSRFSPQDMSSGDSRPITQLSPSDSTPGQIEPGNIDLTARPVVHNPDGSISTVRSISANIDGKETLIPTVSDSGTIMSDKEAIDNYNRTGKHLGKFDSIAAANAAAQQLHNDQAKLYGTTPIDAGNPSNIPGSPSVPSGVQQYAQDMVAQNQRDAALKASGASHPDVAIGGNALTPAQQFAKDQGGNIPALADNPPAAKPKFSTPLQNTQSGTQPEDKPAQLLMPQQQKSNFNLNPEKKYLATTQQLGQENINQMQGEKNQAAQINQMQFVANQKAADMATENANAIMKEQEENKASWDAAMKKADAESADRAARAREISNRKIDPNRYWNNMDTAGRIGAGLALAFGAFAATMRGTPNFGLQTVQKAIDNDIAAQKYDIETAYKGLGMEQDEAHTSIQRAQVDAAYKDKLTLQHWTMVKAQAQGMADQMQAPIDKQKADMTLGAIDNKIRDAKLGMATNLYNFEVLQRKANAPAQPVTSPQKVRDFIEKTTMEAMEKFGYDRNQAQDFAVQQAAQLYNLPTTGGTKNYPGKQPSGADNLNVKVPRISKDGTPVIIDGQQQYVPAKAVNAAAAKEITEGGALEANAKIVELTGRLMKMREEGEASYHPGKTGGQISPEKRAEAERILGELKAAVLKAEGLNRYTAEDNQHVVAAQVPDNPLQLTEPILAAVGSDPTYAKIKDLHDAGKRRSVALTNGGISSPAFGKSDKDIADKDKANER